MSHPKKLIEVALPLDAINKESAREKSIRHGHPSTLHLWWARRPLAACRAVLFSSLVDDPSEYISDPIEADQERQRLFRLIERLVKWDNIRDEDLYAEARREIAASVARNLGEPAPDTDEAIRKFLVTAVPPVYDPFCGGGSIPLEAQRLGLRAHGSDLNPVAVLITKALIEIPPRFASRPPVHPAEKGVQGKHGGRTWRGAEGLADDVRYYGKWMRDEAEKRIGHLYPKVALPQAHGGGEATVIAWLWARTVKCPNPACGARMPLVRSFWLSTKKTRPAWVEPVIDRPAKAVRFEVRTGNGEPSPAPKIGRGATFRCLVCSNLAEEGWVKSEAAAGRMGQQLMSVVAEGMRSRIYLSPQHAPPVPEGLNPSREGLEAELCDNPRWFSPPAFGMRTFADLFTPRQLVALTTFSGMVIEARDRVLADARSRELPGDDVPLHAGGSGPVAYADAVATYLGFAVDKNTLTNCTLATWQAEPDRLTQALSRQALPMTWDYAEANPLSAAGGGFILTLESLSQVLCRLSITTTQGHVQQLSALEEHNDGRRFTLSTDPPYYDNIGYADLSDFFYVWLRRSLGGLFPNLFSTLLVPKSQELIATPYRFDGSKEKARVFFETGLGAAFNRMRQLQDPKHPMTVYYAFKQSESDQDDGTDDNTASTGWESMLDGLIRAGFSITGTWPVRSELTGSLKKQINALATSVVLVCRPRPDDAPVATRKEFSSALRRELPLALTRLTHGGIAPVDLAQASIGPGMAIFSRHSKVLEPDGAPMPVRTALQLINQALDEHLSAQEGEMDRDTRFCLAWFDQHGYDEAPFGDAETLCKAKNTSVSGLAQAGVILARAGKVRLLERAEYSADWSPSTDARLTTWECTQHLIRTLQAAGEDAAAAILAQIPARAEDVRNLAYRLYVLCERKGWAEEALAYNTLVTSWSTLQEKAARPAAAQQQTLAFRGE